MFYTTNAELIKKNNLRDIDSYVGTNKIQNEKERSNFSHFIDDVMNLPTRTKQFIKYIEKVFKDNSFIKSPIKYNDNEKVWYKYGYKKYVSVHLQTHKPFNHFSFSLHISPFCIPFGVVSRIANVNTEDLMNKYDEETKKSLNRFNLASQKIIYGTDFRAFIPKPVSKDMFRSFDINYFSEDLDAAKYFNSVFDENVNEFLYKYEDKLDENEALWEFYNFLQETTSEMIVNNKLMKLSDTEFINYVNQQIEIEDPTSKKISDLTFMGAYWVLAGEYLTKSFDKQIKTDSFVKNRYLYILWNEYLPWLFKQERFQTYASDIDVFMSPKVAWSYIIFMTFIEKYLQ